MIQDWGTALFNALANAVNLILTFIPRLIGILVILIAGLIIAALVAKAVTFLLRKVGFDRMSDRIGLTRFEERMGIRMDTAELLGKIVYWFIVLIFLVPAADALGVPAVSNILNTLVAYIPNVFVAILVLFLGTLAATVVADLVRGAVASANNCLHHKRLENMVIAFSGRFTLFSIWVKVISPETLLLART